MKVILSPRRSGKTTKMIEWLKEDEKHLRLVITHEEELRLKREYPEVRNQIVDWESYVETHKSGSYFKTVSIDNAEMILQKYLVHPLDTITISDELN